MRWYSLAFVAIVASSAPAQTVRILDGVGDRVFTDLRTAVESARSGDVLLLGEGYHGNAGIGGKGLTLVGVPESKVTAGVSVYDVSDRNVVLVGLQLASSGDGLSVTQCRRHVRVQDCSIYGAHNPYYNSSPAARIKNAASVIFKNCTFEGGEGVHDQGYGGPGEAGLFVSGTDVTTFVSLYHCTTIGGDGAEGWPGGDGGPGIWAGFGSWIFAPNTSNYGGEGGWCEGGCHVPGAGGPGILGHEKSVAWFGKTFNVGGPGGWPGGEQGPPLDFDGVLRKLPKLPKLFDAPALVHDGAPIQVSVEGSTGDRAYIALAPRPHFFFVPSLNGAWLIPKGTLMAAIPLGTLPQGGKATFDLTLPPVPAHVARERYFAQGLVLSSNGTVALGDPLHFIVLNYDGAPDCNNNGIQDYVDVIENVFPSGDCNANLIPDDCDIANGTSQDVNGNGIPDECE